MLGAFTTATAVSYIFAGRAGSYCGVAADELLCVISTGERAVVAVPGGYVFFFLPLIRFPP